jgi:hypothetical protein
MKTGNAMNDDPFERERRKQRRFEQIGTNQPHCPICQETDWRCFEATSMPRCANCHIKANVDQNDAEHRQRRLNKLRTSQPRCAMCGETDWRCIEQHHPAGRKRDAMTVLLCANDHLRMTDEQRSHSSAGDDADPILVRISNFLRGLADMLRVIAERLIEFADELLECAQTRRSPNNRSAS